MHRVRISTLLVAGVSLASVAAAPVRFTAPMQPWTSPDGRVSLSRPSTARQDESEEAISTLMSPGWRLVWGGAMPTPGRIVVRLVLKVLPTGPGGTAAEVLQVGVSDRPAAVASCLRYGLDSGSGERRPDRVVNGVRYRVWSNGDAGMSQAIGATDLRAVVDGACYAVERYGFSESASAGDPSVTLPWARGAAELDAALGSLRIGHRAARAPAMRMPLGAVAR